MLIVNKLKSYNSGFIPAVECHSCGNRFITSSTDNKKLCNICKSETKNISSWCVKAEVKIKKRTKYHFIDKRRLYFNISKADAKKLFMKEFKN